ncbi:hypothetical protein TYRP_007752 [Tyrophagus putrescentiae]|nr:hypothetical protein TYRP_007752 [Tyrophagus putrescentiae]
MAQLTSIIISGAHYHHHHNHHHHFLFFFFVIFLLLLQIISNSSATETTTTTTPGNVSEHHQHHLQQHSNFVSDNCDWAGSGHLGADSERSVVPIYLRCSSGTIHWLWPKGGLRVVLRLGGGGDFRGCIRVSRNSTRLNGVRIYLEGKRRLHQIYSADDGKHPDLLRCFVSVRSLMALFIETDPVVVNSGEDGEDNHPLPHPHHPANIEDHFELSYDLTPVRPGDDQDADGLSSTCHPCSPTKLLSLFCLADFVLSGRVTYYHHRPEVALTSFHVTPTYVHRYPSPKDGAYLNDFNATSSSSSSSNLEDSNSKLGPVRLSRPLRCAAQAEARTRVLGNYLITCAPRLTEWRAIARRALAEGTNQCHFF